MPNITTFEILDNEIRKVGGKPKVLEVLWDGDTDGWFICLYIYTERSFFFNKKITRNFLGNITLGSDIRIFLGEPLNEISLANEFGQKAKEKYNVEFYFPSDKEPDNDCPKWKDRELAIKCADCGKLILPTDSEYRPKDICYHCHLAREQNVRILNEEPYDDGVTMYLTKGDTYEHIGYCSDFNSFTIAQFIIERIEKEIMGSGIIVVTLEKPDITELHTGLEKTLNQKLAKYKRPALDGDMKRFVTIEKAEYNGIEYELADRFNDDHREISNFIYSLKTCQKALLENYVYKIYFKKGFTYRDDTVLRYINYICNGSTEIKMVCEHYKKTLTVDDIIATVKKLQQIGCLEIQNNLITITRTGKNIV